MCRQLMWLSLNFTIVDQISQDMLSEESIFHFELLVRITIRMIWLDFPGLVGISFMLQTSLNFARADFQGLFRKTPLRVYDFKKAKVLLNRFGVDLQAPAFDSRLAKYLLSTVEDNEIATIASLYGQTYLVDDETFYGMGVKKAIPEREKLLEHLARKIAVLVETEPVLLEKLSENGQLELLYDMEQPLAFCPC